MTGFARERFTQTSLNGTNSNTSPVTNIINCGTATQPTPVDVTLPMASPTASSSMRACGQLPQALVISEYFNYDRFGEIVLAKPLAGETRAWTPTAIEEPGSAGFIARRARICCSRITLDDGLGSQNPAFTRHPNGTGFALDNYFRGGDTVANAVGVMGFDFSVYRI